MIGMRWLLLCAALASLVLSVPALAAVGNPQLVSSAALEVVQSGKIMISGSVQELTLQLAIPQTDDWQSVESIEASAPYGFATDKYGNRLLKMTWDNPTGDVSFQVRSVVRTQRRTSAALLPNEVFSRPSELVNSADPAIVALAEQTMLAEGTDFDRLAAATAWVHDNIKYDETYADVNLSASRTLELRAGVCDEFSMLLLALMRSAGWRGGYAVGWAFGRGDNGTEDFVAHGWTELCKDSVCYTVDPTWAAIPVDATHIKMATLPDSFHVEAQVEAKGRGNLSTKISPVKTDIKILSHTEDAAVFASSDLLESEVNGPGWAVLKTDLTAPGCALTVFRSQSCTDDGKEFLSAIEPERTIWFCDSREVFSLFKVPDGLDPATSYTCPLTVIPNLGRQAGRSVTVRGGGAVQSIGLAVDKTGLAPGEPFTVSAPAAHIFTDTGLYAVDDADWAAPADNFTVYAYRDGGLGQQNVTVLATRPFDVELGLSSTSITVGQAVAVDVNVTNRLSRPQTVTVRLGNLSRTQIVGTAATFAFNFTPTSTADNVVQTFASTDGFTTSAAKSITVTSPKGWWQLLIEAIRNFFNGLFGG